MHTLTLILYVHFDISNKMCLVTKKVQLIIKTKTTAFFQILFNLEHMLVLFCFVLPYHFCEQKSNTSRDCSKTLCCLLLFNTILKPQQFKCTCCCFLQQYSSCTFGSIPGVEHPGPGVALLISKTAP